MKLLIDIDKELKSAVYNCGLFLMPTEKVSLINAINNGTPIPENATNRDVIKALFPNEQICGVVGNVEKSWWDAPYQKGGKE